MDREFHEGSTRKLLNETSVSEIMSSPAIALDAASPFSEVEEMFIKHHLRHLPLVDKNGFLVGIITQKDLYKIVAPRKIAAQTLGYDGDKILDGDAYYNKEVLDAFILKHVMTKNVCTLGVEGTVGDAIHSIISNEISSVVVVDADNKPLGIITTFDIMKLADKIFMNK